MLVTVFARYYDPAVLFMRQGEIGVDTLDVVTLKSVLMAPLRASADSSPALVEGYIADLTNGESILMPAADGARLQCALNACA